jgi:hypothetical protein
MPRSLVRSMTSTYVPDANMCNDYRVVEQPPTPGEDYGRGRFKARYAPNSKGNRGRPLFQSRSNYPLWVRGQKQVLLMGADQSVPLALAVGRVLAHR